MVERNRRDVLKRTGLAMAGAAFATTGVVADDDGDDAVATTIEDAPGWSSIGGNHGQNPVVSPDDEPNAPVTIAWEYERAGPTAAVDGAVYLTVDGAASRTASPRWPSATASSTRA